MSDNYNDDNTDESSRRVIGCINIALSIDGYIAAKDGNIDWLNEYQSQTDAEKGDGDFGFASFLSSIDVMIMGRKTFDTVIGFGVEMWPYGTVPIIVYTKNSQNVHVPHWIHENGYKVILPKSPPSPTTLFEEIQQDETIIPLTKEEEKKSTIKVYIDGGATIQSFMKEGLVHEMTLTTVPILLGDGIPLFPASATATTHTKLKHRSTTAYSNGAVQSSYIIEKE